MTTEEVRFKTIEDRLDAQAERLEWITGLIRKAQRWGFVCLGVLFVNGNIDQGLVQAVTDKLGL